MTDATTDPISLSFEGCHARWDGTELTVGNAAASRRWRVADGTPITVSLRDERAGREWLAPEPVDAGAERPPAADWSLKPGSWAVGPRHAPGLRVELASPGLRLQVEVFPGVAAVRTRVLAADRPRPEREDAAEPEAPRLSHGVELGDNAAENPGRPARDVFPLAPHHLVLDAAELRGVTDDHAEIVQTRRFSHLRSEQHLGLLGNLFAVEEPASGDGFVLLRQGMLPASAPPPRRGRPDLGVHRGVLRLFEEPAMPTAGEEEPGWLAGDWHAVVLFGGGATGRVEALQRCEHRLRVPRVSDRWMLSNTWGDRGRDGRMSEAFALGEIEAAAALGVDVVQLDDGWQAGRTANSVEAGGKWSGFWESEGFWTPHPERFPRGLGPVLAAAREAGVRLGLWYAPDSSDHFANWEKDARTLLALHREHGVEHFKIDAVLIDSALGEARLHRLFDEVVRGGGGRVTLDLDATAGRRPDFLGRPDAGPVFVQNRYTDWGNWFPHLTLRTLWQLTHWVEPSRLRVEWLNPDRNPDRYDGDALDPIGYPAGYAFAAVMVGAPLAWMELQRLSPERRAEAGPVIRAWREAREGWAGATVVPVGTEPDGFGWTGFAVTPADPARPRPLLVFRENSEDAEFTLRLPWTDAANLRPHLGDGTVAAIRGRDATLRIPTPRSFAWFTTPPAAAG